MPDETPGPDIPEPTLHLIRTLIFFGSAVLAGPVAGLIKAALF